MQTSPAICLNVTPLRQRWPPPIQKGPRAAVMIAHITQMCARVFAIAQKRRLAPFAGRRQRQQQHKQNLQWMS